MFQIQGKVALLVGAGRGIGIELARQLLQQQIKAVVIAESNPEFGRLVVQKLRDEFGEKRVILVQADILNPKELESVFMNTVKLFNQLDIVINNLGLVDENDVDLTQNTSMLMAMRSTKLAVNIYIPQNKLGTEGVVINLNSVVSLGNTPGLNVGSLAGLSAGMQYERNNIRVISLFLGFSKADLLGGLAVNQLVQRWEEIPDLRIQPGMESAGKALISAIEQGVNGSSWVGIRQPQQQLQHQLQQQQQQQQQQQFPSDPLLQGNWSFNQLRL